MAKTERPLTVCVDSVVLLSCKAWSTIHIEDLWKMEEKYRSIFAKPRNSESLDTLKRTRVLRRLMVYISLPDIEVY